MLYKLDYTTRNKKEQGTKWVNFAADRTEAVTQFMDWFFAKQPDDAVRVELVTEVQIVGDMGAIDLIDQVAKPKRDYDYCPTCKEDLDENIPLTKDGLCHGCGSNWGPK